jgi:acetyl-CoA carboxylase carboxyltransferase component
MGVMEGESAVTAVYGPELDAAAKAGGPSPKLKAATAAMRADYEHQLDARFAAARGFADAILIPEELRDALGFTLDVCANFAGPHLGPFVLDNVT